MNKKWRYSPETPNLGQNRRFCVLCDLEIRWRTLKNNRAPLLCYLKLCASFGSHWWIQTGVAVRNTKIEGKICFDLCDPDLWPLTLAFWRASLLSMVITPEHSMMIQWLKHCKKNVPQTDGRTDGQKCSEGCLDAAKNTIWHVNWSH